MSFFTTLEQFVAVVETEIEQARPSAKTVRKFYRQGRKHGKGAVGPQSTKVMVVNGIELAMSKIVEDYEHECETLKQRLAVLDQQVTALSPQTTPPPTSSSSPPAAGSGRTSARKGGGTGSTPDAAAAYERMERRRAEAAAEQERAAGAQRASQAADDLRAVQEEIASTTERLAVLEGNYRQRIRSCKDVGEFVWSDYCRGYAEAVARRARRRKDTGSVQLPDPSGISFEIPDPFGP